ncbi:ABC transporter substrate-binding protein [Olsenella massiliensis]|uniref:ABC transporter substrate-binding protein n=1 Tax=Olsenella massiliensis TaxID=1622075 RepID=UPI00071CF053|nr:ABC transporter substrate-binding protein [Olsenella massiliensis]
MRQNFTRRSFVGLTGGAAALAGLGLAGCGGSGSGSSSASSDAGAAGGGEISVGTAYSTQNYHPSTTSSALALGCNLNVVEGLYEIDFRDYSTRPALAAGDPTMVDDTTYEVKLRDGAKFSDGTDVKASDVASSFARSSKEGNIYVPMLTPIASIEAKDDKTVTIKTSIPKFSLLKERLAIVKVVPESASDDDLTKMPVGTGPWMYDEITDASVTLVPNESYNGDKPAKDKKIRYDVLKDATARVTAAQQGTTLISESTPADSIEQLKGAGLSVDTVQGFGTRFMMFNVTKAPWDNVKVRQAVMYALDYEKMIQNALSGQATAPTCYLPDDPAFPNYHKASMVYTYDFEKATALIDEAGITPGAITLRTTDNDQVIAMSTEVKNNLDALGFKVTIQTDTSAATYAAIDGGEAYDLLLAPGDPSCFGADPDLLLNWWYGNNTWMQKRCQWVGSEEWKTLSSEMTEALKASGDEQQQHWNKCFDLLSENVPLYPVLQVKTSTSSWRENANGDGVKISSDFKGIGTTGIELIGVTTIK